MLLNKSLLSELSQATTGCVSHCWFINVIVRTIPKFYCFHTSSKNYCTYNPLFSHFLKELLYVQSTVFTLPQRIDCTYKNIELWIVRTMKNNTTQLTHPQKFVTSYFIVRTINHFETVGLVFKTKPQIFVFDHVIQCKISLTFDFLSQISSIWWIIVKNVVKLDETPRNVYVFKWD